MCILPEEDRNHAFHTSVLLSLLLSCAHYSKGYNNKLIYEYILDRQITPHRGTGGGVSVAAVS